MSKLNWYVWGATNSSRRPGRFAVQAESEQAARARVLSLYDDHAHRFDAGFPAKVAKTGDDLHGAVLHHADDAGVLR